MTHFRLGSFFRPKQSLNKFLNCFISNPCYHDYRQTFLKNFPLSNTIFFSILINLDYTKRIKHNQVRIQNIPLCGHTSLNFFTTHIPFTVNPKLHIHSALFSIDLQIHVFFFTMFEQPRFCFMIKKNKKIQIKIKVYNILLALEV